MTEDQLDLELERGVWVHLRAHSAVGLLPNDGAWENGAGRHPLMKSIALFRKYMMKHAKYIMLYTLTLNVFLAAS